jgi:hypothetical protein
MHKQKIDINESITAVYIDETTAIEKAGTILSLKNWYFYEIQQFGKDAQCEANSEANSEVEAFEILNNYLEGFKCHGDVDNFDTCSGCGIDVKNPNFESGFTCKDCDPWKVETKSLEYSNDFDNIGYAIADMLDAKTKTYQLSHETKDITAKEAHCYIPRPTKVETIKLERVTAYMKEKPSFGYQLVKVYIDGKVKAEVRA